MSNLNPILVLLVSITLVSCSTSGVPSADSLLALEKQASEAYIKGDAKFFREFMNEKLVMTEAGQRMGKADVINRISGLKCSVKEGWSLSEEQLERLTDDAFVLSYKTTMDGSCTFNGETEKLPGAARSSTLFIRNGGGFQAAFHGDNAIVEPSALSPASASNKENTTIVQGDPGTDALMAAEQAIWEVWKEKDAKGIEALTAKDLTFVNIFGTFLANKTEVIKDWTGSTCDVKSFSLTNGVGTFITPTVGILTFTGTVDGSCGGQKPPPVYGTSIYIKDGSAWKWAFGFNSPD